MTMGSAQPVAQSSHTWLTLWHECLSARRRGLVPSNEQAIVFFGLPVGRLADNASWVVGLPADQIAVRNAPLAIVAGIDCVVYYSGEIVSFGLLSGLCRRLLDCSPRRLVLVDILQEKSVILRLAVNNG